MVSSRPHGLLVGQRFGKYDLLALLAVGGTAEIYLARIAGEAGFEKFVVCKTLLDHLLDQPEYVHMFLDEARIGAQLDHSNIVQTLELGEQDGRYFMIMEYLAGMSLSTMAKKAQQRTPDGLPVDLALYLCAQACGGLHYAHERTSEGRPLNIIHRDVSPQNLVVSFEGVLKLVDFGIAKAEIRETHTKSGTIKGKFAYMSPEQCLGQPLDRRTDIFSLGTILHELLTGRRLFKRGNTYDTYQAIVNGEVEPPSSVNHRLDPGLDDVVMRALSYDRAHRYPTAESLGEALLQVLHRRGKSVGASDVARFSDQTFSEEIEIHATRMRELVTKGRATMQDISWHARDLGSDSASQMPDEPPTRPPTDATMDESPSAVDDDWALDEPAKDATPEAVDDGATRIEPNPLLRVQTMHAQQVKKGGSRTPATRPQPRPQPAGKQRVRTTRETAQGFRPPPKEGAAGNSDPGQNQLDAPTVSGHNLGKKRTPVGKATLMMPSGGAPMPNRPGPNPFSPMPQSGPAPAPAPAPAPEPGPQSAPAPAPEPAGTPEPGTPNQAGTPSSSFPPVHTPTAFRRVGEVLANAPHAPAPGDDLYALASEPGNRPAPWLLIVAFLVSAGLGLGATLLVMKLIA